MTLIQAFIRNTGSPYWMDGVSEGYKWNMSMRLDNDAGKDGG